MANDIEHLFWCLFAICISSSVKYLSFPHFLIGLFNFILLGSESSLYVPETSPLLDIRFADLFSQSVACLLFVFVGDFEEETFLILKTSNLSIFLSYALYFGDQV